MENNMLACSACGTENPDNFKFCQNCGTELKKPEPPKPEPAIKTCPQCNSVFETVSNFCGNCGAQLVIPEPVAEEPEEVVEEVVEEPKFLICSNCGAENGLEFSFCATCGTKLEKPNVPAEPEVPTEPEVPAEPEAPAAPKFCTTCGTMCAPEANFCAVCGTAMAAPVAQPVAEATAKAPQAPVYATVAQPTVQAASNNTYAQPERPVYNTATQTPTQSPYAQPEVQTVIQPAMQPSYIPQPRYRERKPLNFSFDFKKLICSGVLLLLSFLLVVFSFVPVMKYTIKNEETRESISIKIRAVDAINFMFDTIRNQDGEDILDGRLGDKMNALTERLEDVDDLDNLSISEKNAISKLLILQYRASLRLEESKTSLPLVIGGLAALAYVILSIVAFVYAALCLVGVLTKSRTDSKKSIICLIVAPFVALITKTALNIGADFSAYLGSLDATKTSSPLIVWGMIFAGLIVAASLVQRIVFEKKEFSISNAITSGVTFILAIVTVVLCSSGVMKATVKTMVANNDRDTETTVKIPVDASLYNELKNYDDDDDDKDNDFELDDDNKELYNKMIGNMIGRYEDFKIKELKDGKANSTTNSIILTALTLWNDDLISFFALVSLLLLIASAFAALTAAFALARIAVNETATKSMTIFAVFGMIFSVLAFILNFLCMMTANNFFRFIDLNEFNLSLGLGIIALVVFSVLLLVSTRINKAKTPRNRSSNRGYVVNSWGERVDMTRF